jgi:hypothetical protein
MGTASIRVSHLLLRPIISTRARTKGWALRMETETKEITGEGNVKTRKECGFDRHENAGSGAYSKIRLHMIENISISMYWLV